jgi:EmrB/QacA subfamily drug resistance transporter
MQQVHETVAEVDSRRWITLAIVITSIFIVVLDNSVLNVAIPTILRDFHTTLPSLEWVVTGYALTFATLLIIGGRLGDLFGHRRIFIIGAALFGTGSLLASLSWNVPSLVLGEAVIEGVGASLMMPSTLAILSRTFRGRERATAFAAWGATAGVAAAFGPVVGGFLTTNYSWRWSFGINVIVAPLAILGALLVMPIGKKDAVRERLDLPGAAMVAIGMFLLVFGLSEGGMYGWLRPIADFSVAGWRCWPRSRPVSVIPLIFLVSFAVLYSFYRVERAKERDGRGPLFAFGQLRLRTFRYGLLTTVVLAMGQLGLLFGLPVFLQDAKHLSAQTNGLWLLPTGLFIIAGAQIGGRLTHRVGTTLVVRMGLMCETVGLLTVAFMISVHVTLLEFLPGFVLFGLGIGFASSQLTNVVLSEISRDRSGTASGANTTVRQVGNALGVAVIGSVLTAQTIRRATHAISTSSTLSPGVRAPAMAGLHKLGANFTPPAGLAQGDTDTLRRIMANAVAGGTRPALIFAATVVGVGALFSLLIPRIAPVRRDEPVVEEVKDFAAFEPIDVTPSTVLGD